MGTLDQTLAILDVGHGNSAVLIDTEGVVVIDTGRGNALQKFLNHAGINTLDVVILSHADEDHIGGLTHLLAYNEFTIKRIHINTDSAKDSRVWNDLRYELDRAHNAGQLVFETSLVTEGTGRFDQGDVHVEILAPSRYLASGGPGSRDRDGRKITTNSISAVVRYSIQGQPIALLTGDLDVVGLDSLLASDANPHAPILVFPHHGARGGSTDTATFAARLCDAVQPETIVFSIGRSKHDTPRPEIVETIHQKLPDVWIMCTQLAEQCADSVPTELPQHLTHAFAQGKERRQCCAGTILIDLNKPEAILPCREEHLAFVRVSAPQALCLRMTTRRDSSSTSSPEA